MILITLLLAGNSLRVGLLPVVSQFILTVGSDIVFMHDSSRGIQLADGYVKPQNTVSTCEITDDHAFCGIRPL